MLTRPMGPAPQTTTLSPNLTLPLLHACTATERGSNRAPSSRLWGIIFIKTAGIRFIKTAGIRFIKTAGVTFI